MKEMPESVFLNNVSKKDKAKIASLLDIIQIDRESELQIAIANAQREQRIEEAKRKCQKRREMREEKRRQPTNQASHESI